MSYVLAPSIEGSGDGLLNAGGGPATCSESIMHCHCAHESATINIARNNAMHPKESLVVMVMVVDHDYS